MPCLSLAIAGQAVVRAHECACHARPLVVKAAHRPGHYSEWHMEETMPGQRHFILHNQCLRPL